MNSNSKHIVILTGQHLVANPRVWKEANTLYQNGYRVTILTTFYDAAKLAADQQLLLPGVVYKAGVNMITGQANFFERTMPRVWRRVAMLVKKLSGADSVHLLMYSPAQQLKNALAEQADLYIAHQEAGLLIGTELIELEKKVAFDIEDWYSRDYINEFRPVALLKRKEALAAEKGAYISCPSNAMANALADAYSMKRKPTVLYTGFSITENEKLGFTTTLLPNSIVWFSQVVGPHRGLETLIEALNFINHPLELHLLGEIVQGYDEVLNSLLKKKHLLVFHKPVAHAQLLPFLHQFKVGLAIEKTKPDSRNTTVTNKILQYLQAGNFVVATSTLGQKEIANEFIHQIILVDEYQPKAWADAIVALLSRVMPADGTTTFQKFSDSYAWQAQEQKLIAIVKQAIEAE